MKAGRLAGIIIVLSALSHPAAGQSGTAQFCLQTPAGARCVFASMAECERSRESSSTGQCITRTDARGTTGLGEPTARSSGVPTDAAAGR